MIRDSTGTVDMQPRGYTAREIRDSPVRSHSEQI